MTRIEFIHRADYNLPDEDIVSIEELERMDDRQLLVATAYILEGSMKANAIHPGDYSKRMVILARKLGFGITPDNLEKAARELMENKR